MQTLHVLSTAARGDPAAIRKCALTICNPEPLCTVCTHDNRLLKDNSLRWRSHERPSALVCGAGGFIGSHLVRRLKSEGFWVRGVDLKRPEFSETAADDFVLGDLARSAAVARYPRQGVRRGLSARSRYGRRRLYLHRRARRRHHAEFREHQSEFAAYAARAPGRPDLLLLVGLHVSGLQSGRSRQSELRRGVGLSRCARTASTAGRSSSASVSTCPITATTASRHASRATTTSSARRARGAAVARRRRRRFAGKSPWHGTAARSRSGATDIRPARSSPSTSVSKERCASPAPRSSGRSISAPRNW